MRSIAFYGKGGIGKSTVASNVSLLFQRSGHSVLQVGCDPKHDSAQHHVPAEDVLTAMDTFLEDRAEDPQTLFRKVLMIGRNGVHCVEAGGPEPGIGCAGRSISLLLDIFDLASPSLAPYDIIVYDVLGDVVCGGFATPLRTGHAHEIYVVTSGELMSLYAANNIIRGFVNLAATGRLAGIVANLRGFTRERDIIERFAQMAELPIIGTLPRDERHLRAEMLNATVVESYPDSEAAGALGKLFGAILRLSDAPAAKPNPMDRQRWLGFVRDVRHLFVEEAPP